METNETKSKVKHLVVSTATSNDLKTSSSVQCHIRILYCLWLLLACVVGASIWLGHFQIQRLKEELRHEIHIQSRSFVEFNPELRHGDLEYSSPPSVLDEEDVDEEGESELSKSAEQEEFLRVKRRARRHGHQQKIPQKDEQPIYLHQKEGSGLPEDWVWLTSYSRIPVSLL